MGEKYSVYKLPNLGKLVINYTGETRSDGAEEIDKMLLYYDRKSIDFCENIPDLWSIYVWDYHDRVNPGKKEVCLKKGEDKIDFLIRSLHEFGHAVDLSNMVERGINPGKLYGALRNQSPDLDYLDLQDILMYEFVAWTYTFDKLRSVNASKEILERAHNKAEESLESYLVNTKNEYVLDLVSKKSGLSNKQMKNKLNNFYNAWLTLARK